MFKNMFEEIGDPAPVAQKVGEVVLTAVMGLWLISRAQRRNHEASNLAP